MERNRTSITGSRRLTSLNAPPIGPVGSGLIVPVDLARDDAARAGAFRQRAIRELPEPLVETPLGGKLERVPSAGHRPLDLTPEPPAARFDAGELAAQALGELLGFGQALYPARSTSASA